MTGDGGCVWTDAWPGLPPPPPDWVSGATSYEWCRGCGGQRRDPAAERCPTTGQGRLW